MNRFLSREASLHLVQKIKYSAFPWTYDYEKHRLSIMDGNQKELVHFRLPITLPDPIKHPDLDAQSVNYIILLIQSGSCAIGYFENGLNLDHKVFRAYMVRMKQGKSQVKYLKTKGKSRAGSRVRLAETAEFFENINQRLQTYFATHKIDRIALSCSKILIPFLFNSKVPTPFDKKDERIFKIPKHIHTPIYDILQDTNKFLLKGELIYEIPEQNLIEELLTNVAGFTGEVNFN
ncbi:hypothetical protein [Adhaeribacter aquaticus]|uniref:hypothetical protein n=1 Tax=Adhaeribacter aquaticus TaxID=299567 RepID=UPI0003F85EDE|nr:hypothetical protein [Adhaeribacter aquaticus]